MTKYLNSDNISYNLIESDFCIIGAGCAGIILADKLSKLFVNKKIVIIEREA